MSRGAMRPRPALGRIGESLPGAFFDSDLLLSPRRSIGSVRWFQPCLLLALDFGAFLRIPDGGPMLPQAGLPGIVIRCNCRCIIVGAAGLAWLTLRR